MLLHLQTCSMAPAQHLLIKMRMRHQEALLLCSLNGIEHVQGPEATCLQEQPGQSSPLSAIVSILTLCIHLAWYLSHSYNILQGIIVYRGAYFGLYDTAKGVLFKDEKNASLLAKVGGRPGSDYPGRHHLIPLRHRPPPAHDAGLLVLTATHGLAMDRFSIAMLRLVRGAVTIRRQKFLPCHCRTVVEERSVD